MKKATGVVRKLDELGRVVLPIELRRTLNLNEGDGLEIYVSSDEVTLKKYQPGCTFCGGMDETVEFGGTIVCKPCAKAILGKK